MFLKLNSIPSLFLKSSFQFQIARQTTTKSKNNFSTVFFPENKTKQKQHIKDRNLSIYIHIRNVKKVWKSDENKKLPKIKALILLKFPCLVKDSCPNCHPLPVFIFHLSVRHLKSCGDFKWRVVHGATFLRSRPPNLQRS